MRRREYLRSAVAATGLAGLSTAVPPVGGSDDASPSAHQLPADPSTGTDAPSGTDAAGGTDAPSGTDPSTGTDAAGLEPLGSVAVSNDVSGRYQATEAVVTPDGSHAFVSRFDGFEVVDLADPANPEIVHTATALLADERPDDLTTILDLKYNRERLLVSAGAGFGFPGFAVYDVSDPTDPTLSTSYVAGHAIHNCVLHGDHAYLTNRETAEIIDLRPAEPEKVGEWSVVDYDEAWSRVAGGLRTVHDLYVQGDRLYLANWDAGAWIVDVADPTDPTHVGHAATRSPAELANATTFESREPPGNAHYVQPNDDGTLLAVGAESWNVRSNDEAVAGSETGTESKREPSSGTATGTGTGRGHWTGEDPPGGPSGIRLWDVADPSNPTELATIDPPPVPAGEDATYASGYWTTAHNFDIVGDVLYSSWYQGGVKVHDVSDPSNPVEVGAWADGDETMFWTARAAVPGEFFVASSLSDPDGQGPGGLYTFPDPTDNSATITPTGPEARTPASGTPNSTTSPGGTTDTGAPATSDERPPTTVADTTGTATDPSTDDATTSAGNGPGFGPLAALGALGLGALGLESARPDGDDD